jgi:hypothetical protein
MTLKGAGEAPSTGAPLIFVNGDQAYEIECEIEIDPDTRAGLILFYDRQLYCGLGFDDKNFVTHQYGIERGRPANPHGARMLMKVINTRHIVSFHTSGDGGKTWKRFDRGMEVSGYHHNVRGGFLMLTCHPGSLAEAVRDPGATALRRPLGPGSPLRCGRDDKLPPPPSPARPPPRCSTSRPSPAPWSRRVRQRRRPRRRRPWPASSRCSTTPTSAPTARTTSRP